jgi:alkanesulfonate monooxygenase SsuD/methylene tetrahydromethanopterin reductase-like flavin-dependent oxidoreductase (luciferase family)
MPERSRQPLGFALRDAYPWADLAGLTRAGEDAGFDALFLPEVGVRDTLATLAALAGETTNLRLGTGVVPLPSRSPGLLAAAAATVQERSDGRLLLGLGTGPSDPGALDRLRATVGALREAFAGGTGTVEGSPVRSPLPLRIPPELWIAALGPRATVLAGEIADGVILNWCTPDRVATAVTQIADGARRAGRDPADITVAVYVRAALVAGSLDGARAMAADYGSYPAYARQFATMGIDPADPDAVIAGVMLTDRGSAAARLDAYRAAGAHLPIVYPVLPPGGPSADAARSTLEAVTPA